MLLRFRVETLDLELVIEGCAATFYPTLLLLRDTFADRPFTPTSLSGRLEWLGRRYFD